VRRSVLVILAVASLSYWIARAERAPQAEPAHSAARSAAEWVRTSDGWERRGALFGGPRSEPANIHPALVAGLQVALSVLALAALPSRAVSATAPTPAPRWRRLRQTPAAEVAASG
jgi:hypothetical protein